MFGITQRPGQRGQPVINQLHTIGQALEMGERKTVHHACGGNGVCASIIGAVSKTVQTGKTLWYSRSFGEFNQRSALLIKPLMVRNRSHRTSVRASEINHGPPVFLGMIQRVQPKGLIIR